MYIKIHNSYRNVVALCDSDLLGRKFEEGKRQLDVRDSFYNGSEVDAEGAVRILKSQIVEDATFNIVGSESVNLCINMGLVNKENVMYLKNIPFILILV